MSSLQLVPDEETSYLVLYESERYSQVYPEYKKFYDFLDRSEIPYVSFYHPDYPMSPWIRDWLSVLHYKTESGYGFVNFDFEHLYEDKRFMKLYKPFGSEYFPKIANILGLEVKTFSDSSDVFVSNRILGVNSWLPFSDLFCDFLRELGLDANIRFVPDWGDLTGHIDSIYRFIDHKLFVAYSPDLDTPGYYKTVLSGNKVYFIFPSLGESPLNQAFYDYLGFIVVGNKILLPSYDDVVINDFAYKFLSTVLPDYKIIPLFPSICNALARLGGTIHCIVSQFAHIQDAGLYGKRINLKEL
jgi:hypothetical protein